MTKITENAIPFESGEGEVTNHCIFKCRYELQGSKMTENVQKLLFCSRVVKVRRESLHFYVQKVTKNTENAIPFESGEGEVRITAFFRPEGDKNYRKCYSVREW